MSNSRSVGLNIKRRINEIYSAVAPIKAVADAWNLTGDDILLPTDAAMKAAIEAFEVLEITPLRLFEEIQEIKAGATPPPIAGQVIIGWDNIDPKPEIFSPDALPETIKIGSTFVMGNDPGMLALSGDESNWRDIALGGHRHDYEMRAQLVIFPAGYTNGYWAVCDGAAISRTLPGGEVLVDLNCPFGIGDGSTTVNLPTMTAPAGFQYMCFVGYVE